MRTDIDSEIVSSESKKCHFNCQLGVNRKTGRIQWCPDNRCAKLLIIIPATMLPILIVLVLLSQFDVIGSIGSNPPDPDGEMVYGDIDPISDRGNEGIIEESYLDEDDDDSVPDKIKCTAIYYSQSETSDNTVKDLLKDTRTEFIPSQSIVFPPHCNDIDPTGHRSIDPKQRNRQLDDAVYPVSNYWYRHRRSEPTDTIESVISDYLEPNHAFWKGEGTSDSIRSAQAAVMMNYMDHTVDPCTDFYQYACGNWEKVNPIPKDKSAFDTFEMLRESLDNVLRDLLSQPSNTEPSAGWNNLKAVLSSNGDSLPTDELEHSDLTTEHPPNLDETGNALEQASKAALIQHIIRRRTTDMDKRYGDILQVLIRDRYRRSAGSAETKAKYLYDSCMNYRLIESRGLQPLMDLLKSLGGWPPIERDAWQSDKFDWLNLTAQMRLYNNDIFLLEWVGPDIKNSSENIIQIDQTTLGLPNRDFFLQQSNSKSLAAYRDFMESVTHLLGVDRPAAAEISNELIQFETNLAAITLTPEERVNVSILYKRMTVEALRQLIPEMNWTQYLSIVLERPIPDSLTVVLFAEKYVKNLVTLIDQTDRRIVANYLFWRFIRHRINNLDDRFADAKQNFYFELFGREQTPARWKSCVTQVNANMGMAVGAMFVRKYFDENSKKDTMSMTHELQDAFREILNETEWIDEETRELAEAKVNSMLLRIGYPDFILSTNELNEQLKDLEIHPNRYFENTLNLLRHVTRTEQQKMGEVVNKTTWNTPPAVVNAYYSRNKNQIMFPAGILQPPFYHRYFPRALNYGGIGVVIGHELTHGFDDKGRLFDSDGNLQRWWSDNSIAGFHNRASCLISQYSNYTVSEVGMPIDGENTQGENIADNGGIKQAYYAYKKWLTAHENDVEAMANERLPPINATSEQLFFLNFAQVWCGAMRPEAIRNKLKTAVHSPGRFRVIGTLSNSPDFSVAYKCPIGSPMNPMSKCLVW